MVTNTHLEKLDTWYRAGEDVGYRLIADIQQQDNAGWIAYFYFKSGDWESLRQPSFGYGGKTLEEAIERVHNLTQEDIEFLSGLIP